MGGAAARASGILLHPSSLPGGFGIGELGSAATRFLDWLSDSGQSLWQLLPLGPTGFGDSPYACFSSFAGNPLLVSLERLLALRLLLPEELGDMPPFSPDRVDYGALISWKLPLLRRAADRFLASPPGDLGPRFESFRAAEAWWLDDYALFAALKTRMSGAWNRAWPRPVALREPRELERLRGEMRAEIERERVIQLFFFTQWNEVRVQAAARGIRIIGDLPIFAASDSADVWSHRELFLLDGAGRPTRVSGVPPDYFAATGQLWGNPLYDWDALRREGFRFWIDRVRAAFRLFDLVRVDHFRGFEACWSVPADAPTAESGEWVTVPGDELFGALRGALGDLPIIAEDLGVITPEVAALRERVGFPGMRILQFAFDIGEAGRLDASNRFLPHNHAADSVVYTGTHDNDTSRGWWEKRSDAERAYFERYAPGPDEEIEWRLIRMAFASVCRFAVVPMQDVLGLGSEARLNAPGTSGSANWSWRAPERSLDAGTAHRLRELAELYGRSPPRANAIP